MKIVKELSIRDFEAWSEARKTLDRIIELDKVEELDEYIEEIFPGGATETEINDLLWFDSEYIFEMLGINEEEEEEEEEEEQ